MPRDNFSTKTIDRLRMRVAHRCSNPNCRVSTIGPGSRNPEAVANIGKAAHIAAASPGGPRYVASMTSVERSSINNAIWLCSNCAVDIDVDPDSYPIELLNEWKRLAEKAADAEKGKKPPHPEDAQRQLASALTGLPTTFSANAIKNVHGATEQVLEALDSRFRVETSYVNRTTTYTLHATEEVPCKLLLPTAMAQQMKNLIDHGQDVKVPADGIQLIGSPLLERMFSGVELKDAQFSIECNKQPAVQKIKLVDPETGHAEHFDDIVGQISFGIKSFAFEGQACNGILQVAFRVAWEKLGSKTTFSLNALFDAWDNRDIRYLPHFDKLLRLFELIAAGWEFHSELEIDGLSAMTGKAAMPAKSDTVRSTNGFLQYTAIARQIATYVGASIRFVSTAKISRDDFKRVLEVKDTIEGNCVFDRAALNSNSTCTILAKDGASNIKTLVENDVLSAVIIHADAETPLLIFGQKVQLPRVEIRFDAVRPKIHHPDPAVIQDGESVLVEWEPTDSFRCAIRFLEPSEKLPGSQEDAESLDL